MPGFNSSHFENFVCNFSEQKLYPSYGMAMVRIGYALAIILAIIPDLFQWSAVWGPDRSFLPVGDERTLTSSGLVLVFLTLTAAIAMLVGFMTRVSVLVLAVVYRLLVERNIYLSDGGDNLLFIALIFLVFANTADVWSIDASIRRKRNCSPRLRLSDRPWFTPIANGAWCLLIVQVCVVYAVAGLSKIAGERWMGGDGVAQSLMSVQFQVHPWLSNLLLDLPGILAVASIFTVLVQVYFPFLIFNRWTKLPTLFVMITFHAGIAVVMGLTSFALVMISSEMAFVSDKNMRDWFFNRRARSKSESNGSDGSISREDNEGQYLARSVLHNLEFSSQANSVKTHGKRDGKRKKVGLLLIPPFLLTSNVVAPQAFAMPQAQEDVGESQLIVSGEDVETSVAKASALTGISASINSEELAIGGYTVSLDVTVPGQTMEFVKSLSSDHGIDFVEIDRFLKSSQDSIDSMRSEGEKSEYHWNIGEFGFPALWEESRGEGAVIAVVDTGILPHPALVNRVLPGVDLIDDAGAARDGDGRDMDPTDEGDWTRPGQCSTDSPGTDSTFHGTILAGAIAGNAGNSFGIVGAAPEADILPIRVSGVCGARVSDIAEGIVWAVGKNVQKVDDNLNPADVINVSFAIENSCSVFLKRAVDVARTHGAHVVTSSGNHGSTADDFSPGNCGDTFNVGAINSSGKISLPSNFGESVDIYGPGGDWDEGIAVPAVEGGKGPTTFSYRYHGGTSLAAAHVSAALGLITSMYPHLSVGEREKILIDSSEIAEDENGRGKYRALSLKDTIIDHPISTTPPTASSESSGSSLVMSR